MVFGPALDDYFFVCVKLNGVTALAMHVAKKAVFPAAEWEIRHGRRDADVDADISGRRFIAEPPRSRAASSEA